MRLRFILSVALTVASVNAMALGLPISSKHDTRIQYIDYNAGDVVVVRTTPGIATRIVFSGQETVSDIATGFTDGWELMNRANVLYLKPRSVKLSNDSTMKPTARKWDTNLMVRTNKRLYDFDLRLISSRGSTGRVRTNSKVAYRIQFRYPDEIASKKAAANMQSSKYEPRNDAYSMRVGAASRGIAPTAAYDDGVFTYLKFPNNRDFPVAFLLSDDKTESLVNSHVEGDTLVIHRVAPTFILRFGKQIVGIYNDAYDIDGVPPIAGTTAPNIRRVLKGK